MPIDMPLLILRCNTHDEQLCKDNSFAYSMQKDTAGAAALPKDPLAEWLCNDHKPSLKGNAPVNYVRGSPVRMVCR